MKKHILAISSVMILFAACDKKEKTLSDSAIHAKVDSIVGSRMQELNKESMEDLDKRATVEVRAKADSIIDAHTHPKDTVSHAHAVTVQMPGARQMPNIHIPIKQ